jgi:hypothetical protein
MYRLKDSASLVTYQVRVITFEQSSCQQGALEYGLALDIRDMRSLTFHDGIMGHGYPLSTMHIIKRKTADHTAMIFCMRVKYHLSINAEYSRCLVYLLLSAVGEGSHELRMTSLGNLFIDANIIHTIIVLPIAIV